jgi:tripartite-type tricarboxylate transporter receptor subunit TctC
MRLPRREFLHLAAAAAALPATSRIAIGDSFPSRPVRLIVGFPAGYATDIVARLIAQTLSERLGQQVSSRTVRGPLLILLSKGSLARPPMVTCSSR